MSLLPKFLAELCAEAERRIASHLRSRGGDGDGFVSSGFTEVHAALAHVVDRGLAPGRLFCEWGSGFGVVALIASHLGLEAHGIEIQHELVDAACELAYDFDLEAAFALGTFVPRAARARDDAARFPYDDQGERDGHEELGLTIAELDLVFGYPWPDERWAMVSVFEEFAAPGALLMTYGECRGVRVAQKTPSGTLVDVAGEWGV